MSKNLIRHDDMVHLRAICSDWHARNLKRKSIPPGLTMGAFIKQLELADRVVKDITTELGDHWEAQIEIPE